MLHRGAVRTQQRHGYSQDTRALVMHFVQVGIYLTLHSVGETGLSFTVHRLPRIHYSALIFRCRVPRPGIAKPKGTAACISGMIDPCPVLSRAPHTRTAGITWCSQANIQNGLLSTEQLD